MHTHKSAWFYSPSLVFLYLLLKGNLVASNSETWPFSCVFNMFFVRWSLFREAFRWTTFNDGEVRLSQDGKKRNFNRFVYVCSALKMCLQKVISNQLKTGPSEMTPFDITYWEHEVVFYLYVYSYFCADI